jgi:hypothetical protein
MTLKYLFQAETTFQHEEQILKTNPQSISGSFSPEFTNAIMRLLEKDQNSRILLSRFQNVLDSLQPNHHEIENSPPFSHQSFQDESTHRVHRLTNHKMPISIRDIALQASQR